MATNLKNFLEIPYDKLEEMNLKAKESAEKRSQQQLEKEYTAYLKKEKRIKAVTLCFTDIEGRLHMLDYDKKFLLDSLDNLTFDGSSIKGFTPQHESDLRLEVDWASIRHLPSDVFGPGKVIFFASVQNRDRTPYASDFRSQLRIYTAELRKKQGLTAYASVLDVPVAIDIASFYVPPEIGEHVIDEVARKKIPEVWLNPGSESDRLIARARALSIQPIVACSIVAIGQNPYAI